MHNKDTKYRSFFDNSADAMLILENNEFMDCNAATIELLGYSNKEEIINKRPSELSPEFQSDRSLSFDKAAEMIRIAQESGNHRFEWDHLRKDGSIIPVEVTLTAVNNNDGFHLHTVLRDISMRKQSEKALIESEKRFRHTFETNPDPVILAALEDGSIIDVNNAFVTVTGISRLEAIGHNSEQLNLWRDKSLRELFREQLQSRGEVNNFVADFNVVEGQLKTGLLSARIITLKEELCILVTLRDITSEKEAELALIEMDQIKSDFISTAAHELRTPLTAIMGYTEMLLDPLSSNSLTEEAKTNFLHEICNRGESLNRMIEDFLDISRIESGLPIPMDLRESDITYSLKKAFNYYHLHEKGFTFQLVLPEEEDDSVLTFDRHRICQVLENLLRNAVKYSPAGNKIVLRGNRINEGWEISVEDQGIGMNQEQLSRIFDKFYRANPSDTRTKGLGLGMSIVKHIVEAHGGTIRAESQEGKGTSVSFLLPHIVN